MRAHYRSVARRAGHRCEYCHAPEAVFNLPFEIEHILPSSAGGSDTLDNLALACRSCNAFKGFRQFAPDPETGESVPLFHPRRDSWEEHFLVDTTTHALLGRTPTGRATICQLRMNSDEQQQARAYWQQIGHFP